MKRAKKPKNIEQTHLLEEVMRELRALGYSKWAAVASSGEIETREVPGNSGQVYQLEIQAFWDDKAQRNVRVVAAIDSGGWDAMSPQSDDFIVAPDGSFVGE